MAGKRQALPPPVRDVDGTRPQRIIGGMAHPVLVMVDSLYGPLDGLTDTAEVDLDEPLGWDFAQKCDMARRVSETSRRGEVACISDLARVVAETNGAEVGRVFEVCVDAWPRCKFPHVIGSVSVEVAFRRERIADSLRRVGSRK